MKTFQKFPLLAGLTLALSLRAATNEVQNFSGVVVDGGGNPVAGATVTFVTYPQRMGFQRAGLERKQRATTGAQGGFEFPKFRGEGVVVATKAGFAPGWQSWYAGPGGTVKIILGAPSVLAGAVVDDGGRPVPGAGVWVASALNKVSTDFGQPNFLFGEMAREEFSARTAADGKFRIENFPAGGQALLSVKRAGFALRPMANPASYGELPFHDGQEDIVLTLDPAGTVTGKVVERATGQPLGSACLGLLPAAPGTAIFSSDSGMNRSAADGTFQISDVAAGSYQIEAYWTNEPVPEWIAEPVAITVGAGETVSDVRLEADKGGIVEVTVRGKANEELIAQATISAFSQAFRGGFNPSGMTGGNGVGYLRLPAGQYSVAAQKQDWCPAQESVTVAEGQTNRVTFHLAAAFKVGGIVRDGSGTPVEGASVGVVPYYGGFGSSARTDANGHYELSWEKPAWNGGFQQGFYLLVREAKRKLAAIKEIDETTTNLDVTLEPGMSLSGSVRDTTGKAVTNAAVYVSIHNENSNFTISRQDIHCDDRGRFHAEALPRGERYGFYVYAHGYGSGHEDMEAADPEADHYDFPPVLLKIADRRLGGLVLGTNGAPVAGVQVWMQGEGQPGGQAWTDAKGRFVFDAVCDGAVTLNASFNGAYGSTEAMGGQTNAVIRFNAGSQGYMPAPPKTLTGTVQDASGNPEVGAVVIVTPSWGPENLARTDAKGEYSIDWQAQTGMRNVKHFVVARDVEQDLAAIESIGVNQKSADLRLGPGLSISGTVDDEKGAPLPRANINLNIMAGNMGGMVEYGRIRLHSDGTFTIPALPMGQQYMVSATADGYGTEGRNVGAAQSRTNSVRLAAFRLRAADRLLAGIVLGTDNKPLMGAHVSIFGRGQPNGNTSTDATGHFEFKVCGGPVRIFVWSPSQSGRNRSANCAARGGDTHLVVKMGARQSQRQMMAAMEIPLKPQLWTLGAVAAWPVQHKVGAIILLSLQAALLLGTAGGIFWHARRRPLRP